MFHELYRTQGWIAFGFFTSIGFTVLAAFMDQWVLNVVFCLVAMFMFFANWVCKQLIRLYVQVTFLFLCDKKELGFELLEEVLTLTGPEKENAKSLKQTLIANGFLTAEEIETYEAPEKE